MGAYKCPACRGTDVGDNAGGMKCLGCGAELKFVPGPALALLNEPEPVEEPAGDNAEQEPVAEPSGE